MKNILISLLCVFTYCQNDNKPMGDFSFYNFKNTPLENLALAIQNNDLDLIDKEINKNKHILDSKEPNYEMNLLTLSIINNKKIAFSKLLENGSNPNVFVGINNNYNPLIEAIYSSDNCDLFYISKLLDYGANPNYMNDLKISHLHTAIGLMGSDGRECVNIVKLLIENGADVSFCKESNNFDCEGVINLCLNSRSMEVLKYLVVDKKINTSNFIYRMSGNNGGNDSSYTLLEILKHKKFDFSDTVNNPKVSIEMRDQLINFLEKSNK